MSVTSIEDAEVHRRHQRAMGVVLRVDDEMARWKLLEYVLVGNPRVDAVIERARPRYRRGVRPVLTDRHRAAVRLRNEGLSFRQIAERLDYRHEAAAKYAYESGLSKLVA